MSIYRFKDYILPTGIILFWICYWIYYPNFYAFQDERIYLEKAHQFSQGVISWERTDDRLDISINKYPPGQSILLAFLLKLGYRYTFLLNPVFLTLTTLIFAKLMKQYSIPNYFALLFLFHPVMFIFSRTVMSDIPTAFFFLLAVWIFFFRKGTYFVGAVALGYCVSLRISMIPFSGFCIVYALLQGKNNARHVIQILAGFFLGIIPFLTYIYQVNIFSSSVYGSDADALTSLGDVISHAAAYFISLNFIYPLMLIIGIYPRYEKGWLLKGICVMAFLFFPFFIPHPGMDIYTTIVLIQRYFIFVIGLLLIGYSLFLSKTIITNEIRYLPVFLFLVVGAFFLSSMHQNVLNHHYTFHKVIYEHTTEGSLLISDDRNTELIQVCLGDRKIINTEFATNNEEIFRKIELFLPRDVYLIYLDRRDGAGFIDRKSFDAILERFQYKKVADYEQNWSLKIFKIS